VPPNTILDLSTYDKTVEEVKIAKSVLIQRMREATPAENELRNLGIFHQTLIKLIKSTDALNNTQKISNTNSLDAENVNQLIKNDDMDCPAIEPNNSDSEAEFDSNSEASDLSAEYEEDSMQFSDDDIDVSIVRSIDSNFIT